MLGQFIYLIALVVFLCGLYIMLTSDNYIRKVIGLGVFQNSILVFYIALGKVKGGIPPINLCSAGEQCQYLYSSPLPQVLMLTAIVVGFATMAVALALIMRIKHNFGTISEQEVNDIINS